MKQLLDVQDRRILDLLIRNSRISVSDLATQVGLSRTAIAERMQKLQKQGIIRGYTTVVSRFPDEAPVTAFIAARTPRLIRGKLETALLDLSRRAEVLEMHRVAGEDCIYMKVRVRDIAELNALTRELQQPPFSMDTRTTIVLSTYFEKVGGIVLSEKRLRER